LNIGYAVIANRLREGYWHYRQTLSDRRRTLLAAAHHLRRWRVTLLSLVIGTLLLVGRLMVTQLARRAFVTPLLLRLPLSLVTASQY